MSDQEFDYEFDYEGRTGYEPITDVERKEFSDQGFLLLRGALTDAHRAALERSVDRVHAGTAERRTPDGRLHLLGFLPHDELFGRLLTHPVTFPYVWGLLGWNVHSHHSHLDVTPPAPDTQPPGWAWHQDGYRQNSDPETLDPYVPRPMLSIKIGYVLSDLSETGRGATKVIPGSHLLNRLPRPADVDGERPDPPGTIEITAQPGDAFLFDRRLWHSRSPNRSPITRKMLFVGYTYRWIRALDEVRFDRRSEWWQHRDAVQRQLLGEAPHAASYWGIDRGGSLDDAIPLRAELMRRNLLDRDIPWLR